MSDERLKNLRGKSRRDFLRWTTAIGAAIGLDRSGLLNAVGESGGSALADTLACLSTNRSVHLVGGNGGFAWFQLLWPHVAIANAPGSSGVAFHAPGQQIAAQGTTRPMMFAPQTPFQSLPGSRQMTAFMAGAGEAHTLSPISAATISPGLTMMATCAAIQQANPTLLPVIGVGSFVYGAAPGAPAVAAVPSAAGLVNLFNSAASQTILSKPQAGPIAESYYKTFLTLNRAAGRTTMQAPYATGKVAMNLLGQNLADKIRPTAEDETRYGIGPGTMPNIAEMARTLCSTAKAFGLGLTSSVLMPAMLDDPHGAFAGGTTAPTPVVAALGKVFDAFYADMAAIQDPARCGKSLADNFVMTIHGDIAKDPLSQASWLDITPMNSNWMYVLGAGYLKTGWFGGIDTAGNVAAWDPQTGKNVAGSPGQLALNASAASAAVAFAVARGDNRRVQDFYRGAIDGVVNVTQM